MLHLSIRSDPRRKAQTELPKLVRNYRSAKLRQLSSSREILCGLSLMLISAVKQREATLLCSYGSTPSARAAALAKRVASHVHCLAAS